MNYSSSCNLLFDQRYAQMNGLMVGPFMAPGAGVQTPTFNPTNNGGSQNTFVPNGQNQNNTTNYPTEPYTMDDFRNEFGLKPGENNTQPNTAVQDELDDGKISFKSKIKNFGKGLISPLTNIIKHPIASIAGIGVGAALTVATSGAILPAFIALGVVSGAFKIGKGIYQQATAKTDAQAEAAWQSMGSGTADVGLSVAFSKGALKGSGNVPKGGFLKSTVDCFKLTPGALKTSFGMVKDGLAWYNIKNFFSNLFKKTPELPEQKPEKVKQKRTSSNKKGTTTTHEITEDGTRIDTRYNKGKVREQTVTSPDGNQSTTTKFTNGERPESVLEKVNGHKTTETRIRYDNKTYAELGQVQRDAKTGVIQDIKIADGQGGYSNTPKGFEVRDINGRRTIVDTRSVAQQIADQRAFEIRQAMAKANKTTIPETVTPKYNPSQVPTQKPSVQVKNPKNVSSGTYRRHN